MLVLSRKQGQRVLLTGGISVTVTEIKGDKVRLGFEAPPTVNIARKEVAGDEFDAAEQSEPLNRLGPPTGRLRTAVGRIREQIADQHSKAIAEITSTEVATLANTKAVIRASVLSDMQILLDAALAAA